MTRMSFKLCYDLRDWCWIGFIVVQNIFLPILGFAITVVEIDLWWALLRKAGMENFMAYFWLNKLPYSTSIHKDYFKNFLPDWTSPSSAVCSHDGQSSAQENPLVTLQILLDYSCPFSGARRAVAKDSGRYSPATSREPTIYL